MRRLTSALLCMAVLGAGAAVAPAAGAPETPKGVTLLGPNDITGKDTAGLSTVSSFTVAAFLSGRPNGVLLTSGGAKALELAFNDSAVLTIKGQPTKDVFALPKALEGWHHWAVTFDNTHPLFRVRVYLDGRPVLNTYPLKYWPTHAISLKGAALALGPAMKKGVKDFRLYASARDGNAALGPLQIAALAGKPLTEQDLLEQKLAVKLPKGAFKDEPLVTVLVYIRERSRLLGPLREGVRVFINQPKIEMKRVTIDLAGKTVREALEACAKLGGLAVETEAPDIVRLVKQ